LGYRQRAGTIYGVALNGQSVGVAPDAKLYSGLVIEGGNTTVRILEGWTGLSD
jgi:hypothetical protein